MEQSLMKRLPQKTPIKNLYLAGAWGGMAGGGQSAVLMGGDMAANTILGREK
jgi:phytoene dehydrogenase-like protein